MSTVTVNCMPVMPGINDTESELGPLFEAAVEAGATDVHQNALFLRPATRAVFFPWLEKEFPHLVSSYRRLYERSDYLEGRAKEQLLSTFRRLRLQHGLPKVRADQRIRQGGHAPSLGPRAKPDGHCTPPRALARARFGLLDWRLKQEGMCPPLI